jgi:hypothetical protein
VLSRAWRFKFEGEARSVEDRKEEQKRYKQAVEEKKGL